MVAPVSRLGPLTPRHIAAAYQNERKVKVYDTARGWRVRKDVHARGLRWTITDTALSRDERFL